jgi:hypothetical protein
MIIKGYALFFLILFSTFLAAPSLIKFVKANADTAYFFNATEEEKKENNLERETHFIASLHSTNRFMVSKSTENSANFVYAITIYPLIILDKNSPPPEFS